MDLEKISLIISAVVLAIIIALYALTVFSRKVSDVFGWVNAALHIPLTVFLFFGGVSLKVLLLIFSFSALVYTLFSFVAEKCRKRATLDDAAGEEASDS